MEYKEAGHKQYVHEHKKGKDGENPKFLTIPLIPLPILIHAHGIKTLNYERVVQSRNKRRPGQFATMSSNRILNDWFSRRRRRSMGSDDRIFLHISHI